MRTVAGRLLSLLTSGPKSAVLHSIHVADGEDCARNGGRRV